MSPVIAALGSDLLRALRRLRRAPASSAPALLAIVLAGTALMLAAALVQGVLLAPLPYPQAERVHYLGWRAAPGNGYVSALTASQASALLEQAGDIGTLGSYADPGTQFTLDGRDGELAMRVPGMRADAGLLPALGVQPQLGRGFHPEEAEQASKRVIISARLWRERFAGASLADASLRIDGDVHQVVGVLPQHFRFYPEVDLLVPSLPGGIGAGGSNTHVLARLAEGLERGSAQQRLDLLAQRLRAADGSLPEGAGPRLQPLQERVVGNVERFFAPLLGAVGVLVLLACVNVANLLIGDRLARRGDAAVELAMGATSTRLLARLAIDVAVLWTVGLLLAGLLAAVILPLLPNWLPFSLPRLAEVRLDAASLALAAAVGVVVVALCVLLGAFGARVRSIALALRRQGAGRGAGVGAQPLLVAAQVALSCVLLAGCALMLGSALRTAGVDPGFRSEGIQTVQLALADARYRDEQQASARTDALLQALQDALADQPGIRGSASVSSLPLETGLNNWVEFPAGAVESGASLEVRVVSDGYFGLLRAPLLAGSAFDGSEAAGAERRLVVNAALAQRYFGEPARALDARLRMDGEDWRVVGVVADLREAGLREPALPTVFVPRAQFAPALQAAVNRWFLSALLIDAPAGQVEPAIRAALAKVDPGVALVRVRPLDAVIATSLASERFFGILLLALSATSLLLTGIGLYGVLGQLQWLRRHEMAVRLALGSDARRNGVLLLRDGLRWIALGVLLGLPAALATRPVLAGLLDDAGLLRDLPFLLVAAFALLAACLLASALPLARARRVQPMQALRSL